ncbi:replication initiation factor domain-containing protein, partial [Oscillospiraceae bacterium OttesenSCG-928-G22]|nr:replication initiation factor domain-containing protein [Oscillospiraceae bacterium OttesenSCG-928-G22]
MNTPTILIGVDEITIVLLPLERLDCLLWVDTISEIIEIFIGKSKIEELFGKMDYAQSGLQQGYTHGLIFSDRPWHFGIYWHEDFSSMGICIKFSAYAYAAYMTEYSKRFGTPLNVASFLRMIQSADYSVKLSRVDLTADYINYDNSINPDTIYEDLKAGTCIILDHKNRSLIRSKSAIDKDGKYSTIYLGSRKSKTNCFMRIYNKRLEQIQTMGFRYDEALQYDSWIRFEAVFRHDYARAIGADLIENVLTPADLQQFIAQKITEKFRFFDFDIEKKAYKMKDYTQDLLDIASTYKFDVLRSEAPTDNDLRQTIIYLQKSSGLYSTLFKVNEVWGDGTDSALM